MTTMATKNTLAPPIISSRNKSLVSFRENLLEGYLDRNINNKSTIEVQSVGKPACISPNNSSNNLQHQVAIALDQQHLQEREPSPRPFKKRKVRPASTAASIAVAEAEELSQCQRQLQQQDESTAILQRKALAAQLRARGVSLKFVLKPSDFARSVFCKNRNAAKIPIEIPCFAEPSEIDLEIHARHSQVIYDYIRKGTDLEGFKKCVHDLQQTYHGSQADHEQQTPKQQQQPFRCCNRFGESLMHLACRRGRTEMVRFLVEELPGGSPSQMLTIKDDCHKTPLHDACWTPSPNFELVDLILHHAPEQLLMQDIRGNTPFDYVRKEDYALWLRFLWERRSILGVRGPTVSSEP